MSILHDIFTRSTGKRIVSREKLTRLESEAKFIRNQLSQKSTSSIITRDDVCGVYRYFLGRLPESESVIQRHLQQAQNTSSLRARILAAPEFYKVNARDILRYFAEWEAKRVCGKIEYECSRSQLEQLFSHIKAVWNRLGEIEPHYSVVSTINYKPENVENNISSFRLSGRQEVKLLQSELHGHGCEISGYRQCVELGSGVGRVSRFLAEISEQVSGHDISASHLNLAREYIAQEGITNVAFYHVTELSSLVLPQCDLFYSRLVLQHNPPPVMMFLVRKILSALNSGGVAVFQLPTYIENYAFSVNDYLARMNELNDQEIHALPQRAIFAAIADSGCDVLSAYRDNSLSAINSESNRFIVIKR